MSEELDQAQETFSREIAPASRPRDQAGRFVSTPSKPEAMFSPRPIEGDPLTGDVRDAGDDQRLLDHERKVADGWATSGDEDRERKRLQDDAARARRAHGDDGHDDEERVPERIRAGESDEQDSDAEEPDQGRDQEGQRRDAEGQSEQDAESLPFQVTLNGQPVEKFEVQVDGAPVEVSLNEALKGYVRGQEVDRRMGQFREAATGLQSEANRLAQWQSHLVAAQAAHEADIEAILPKEPNWDEMFKADPAKAHELQKQYAEVRGKLFASRQARAQAAQQQAALSAQQAEQYAVQQFGQFVQEAKIENEGDLKRELDSMRRTAFNAGFSEAEVATVYDKRMLAILRKASKYDRMMAARPKPLIPGKGKTLTPGAAQPLANGARRSFDDVLSRQAKSGKMDDTIAVFARMLK